MDIVINEATYSLPCKTFYIDYSVSEKRQLPVVKEFVVRFLYAIGTCNPESIREFFGFTRDELSVVLSDLEEERLIKWEDDEISLTSYTVNRFESVNGKNIPRFYEVIDEMDSVGFELYKYRFITEKAEGESQPCNIEIKLGADSYCDLSSKASSAFDANFTEFLEKVKHVDVFNIHKELYKINSIIPKHDFMLPIKVKYLFNEDNDTHPFLEYADQWMEEFDEDNSILGQISDSLSDGVFDNAPQGAAVQEYLHATYDPVVTKFANKNGVQIADLINYYKINRGFIDAKTMMMIGAVFTKKNIKIIKGLLESIETKENKLASKGVLWTVWPDGKLWGRSPELKEFVSYLNNKLDTRYKPGKTVMCLPADSRQEARNYGDIYGISGALFKGSNTPFCNTSTEILLIPGVLVASIFHLQKDGFGNLTIPVGYVSIDAKYVQAVQKNMTIWASEEANFNGYFEKKKQEKEQKQNQLVQRILS